MTDDVQAKAPLRQVTHIENTVGRKGGEVWWLTLECGHHKAVRKPRYRPELHIASMPRRIERGAPHRCRCTLCVLICSLAT